MHYYYDGAELGTAVPFAVLPDGGDWSHLVVGGNAAADAYAMDGVLDEVRISSLAVDADYVKLEYASMTGGVVTPVMDP